MRKTLPPPAVKFVPTNRIPETVTILRLVIVLIAIGFPIALVIAWAFEATPEGIKRTEVATPNATAHAQLLISRITGHLGSKTHFTG
jgi:hypothetical protein